MVQHALMGMGMSNRTAYSSVYMMQALPAIPMAMAANRYEQEVTGNLPQDVWGMSAERTGIQAAGGIIGGAAGLILSGGNPVGMMAGAAAGTGVASMATMGLETDMQAAVAARRMDAFLATRRLYGNIIDSPVSSLSNQMMQGGAQAATMGMSASTISAIMAGQVTQATGPEAYAAMFTDLVSGRGLPDPRTSSITPGAHPMDKFDQPSLWNAAEAIFKDPLSRGSENVVASISRGTNVNVSGSLTLGNAASLVDVLGRRAKGMIDENRQQKEFDDSGGWYGSSVRGGGFVYNTQAEIDRVLSQQEDARAAMQAGLSIESSGARYGLGVQSIGARAQIEMFQGGSTSDVREILKQQVEIAKEQLRTNQASLSAIKDIKSPAYAQAKLAVEQAELGIYQAQAAGAAAYPIDVAREQTGITSATLGLQRKIISGQVVGQADYGALQGAMNAQLATKKAQLAAMNESPEKEAMKQEVANLEFQASIGLQQQENERIWAQKQGQMQSSVLAMQETYVKPSLMGSYTERTAATFDMQTQANEAHIAFLNDQLKNDHTLDAIAKQAINNQIESLKIQDERLAIQKRLALVEAGAEASYAHYERSTYGAQIALTTGIGGIAAYGQLAIEHTAAAGDVRVAEKAFQQIVNLGYSQDTPEYADAARKVQQAKMAERSSFYGQFQTPTSASTGIAAAGAGIAGLEYQFGSGANPYEAQLASYQAMRGEVSQQRQVLAIAQGTGDTKAIAVAQQNLADKIGQLTQSMDALAHPYMPISEQVGRSTVGAKLAISQMTFAGESNVRGDLESQMGYAKADIQRLIARRSDLQAQGALTPAIDASIQEQINDKAVESAQSQQRLENGWLDRLISTAYNAPSNGMLATSAFTRRESAMFAGVYNMSFGGTQQQMQYAGNGYNRILQNMGDTESILGGGQPSSFYDAMFGRGSDGMTHTDPKSRLMAARQGSQAGASHVSLTQHLTVNVKVDKDGKGSVTKTTRTSNVGDDNGFYDSKMDQAQQYVSGTSNVFTAGGFYSGSQPTVAKKTQ